MNRRLLDYDPWTGVATYHSYDHTEKKTWIEEVQDAQPRIELNKSIQTAEDGGAMGHNALTKIGFKREWWYVASIPIGVQYKWLREKGVDIHNKDHWPKVRQLLNDPEYRYLRTGTGRV